MGFQGNEYKGQRQTKNQ